MSPLRMPRSPDTSCSVLLTQARHLAFVGLGTPSYNGSSRTRDGPEPGPHVAGPHGLPSIGVPRSTPEGDRWAKPPDWHPKAPEDAAAPPGDARPSLMGVPAVAAGCSMSTPHLAGGLGDAAPRGPRSGGRAAPVSASPALVTAAQSGGDRAAPDLGTESRRAGRLQAV